MSFNIIFLQGIYFLISNNFFWLKKVRMFLRLGLNKILFILYISVKVFLLCTKIVVILAIFFIV